MKKLTALTFIIGLILGFQNNLLILQPLATALLLTFLFLGCLYFMNALKESMGKAKLFEVLQDKIDNETRVIEKELFKRDRAIKDTKTVKKILKVKSK